jgi:hypothetical protein
VKCDHPNCAYKAKQRSDVIKHKSSAHNVSVNWHVCDEPDCFHKSKLRGNLRQHKARRHPKAQSIFIEGEELYKRRRVKKKAMWVDDMSL